MKSKNNNNDDDDDDDGGDDDDDDNNNNTAMGSVHAQGDTFLTFGLKALTETNTSRQLSFNNKSARMSLSKVQRVFIVKYLLPGVSFSNNLPELVSGQFSLFLFAKQVDSISMVDRFRDTRSAQDRNCSGGPSIL
jgi:hypothetical protein